VNTYCTHTYIYIQRVSSAPGKQGIEKPARYALERGGQRKRIQKGDERKEKKTQFRQIEKVWARETHAGLHLVSLTFTLLNT